MTETYKTFDKFLASSNIWNDSRFNSMRFEHIFLKRIFFSITRE